VRFTEVCSANPEEARGDRAAGKVQRILTQMRESRTPIIAGASGGQPAGNLQTRQDDGWMNAHSGR
jgi:hypothetical protein